MSRFDRVAVAIVAALGLLAIGLSVASARLGPSVEGLSTVPTVGGVSVDTEIVMSFSEPMDRASVLRSLSLQPATPGTWQWAGNQLLFVPRHPLAHDTTYSVTLSPAASDAGGRHLFRAFHASFRTSSEHVVYVGTEGDDKGRLVLASTDGAQQVIGAPGVTDVAASFDRTLLVYARRSAPGDTAHELWLLSLADDSTQRLFRRAQWTISQPHFSPDGRYIVFLATGVTLCQPGYGCYRDRNGPVIYLYDLRSRRVHPFHSVSDVPITNFIDFSPAGQIAYTDLGSALTLADPSGAHVVHIPNQGNSLVYVGFDPPGNKAAFVGQTPSSTGGEVLVYSNSHYVDVSHGVYDSATPSFSPSGEQVAYAAYRGEEGIEPIYGINVYDFRSRRTTRLTNPTRWSDWMPEWSQSSRWIAFLRSSPREEMYMGSGEVWVMRSNGTAARPLGGVGTDPIWLP